MKKLISMNWEWWGKYVSVTFSGSRDWAEWRFALGIGGTWRRSTVRVSPTSNPPWVAGTEDRCSTTAVMICFLWWRLGIFLWV